MATGKINITTWGGYINLEYTGGRKNYTPLRDGFVVMIVRNENNSNLNNFNIYDNYSSNYLAIGAHIGANQYSTLCTPVYKGHEIALYSDNSQTSGTQARFIPLI